MKRVDLLEDLEEVDILLPNWRISFNSCDDFLSTLLPPDFLSAIDFNLDKLSENFLSSLRREVDGDADGFPFTDGDDITGILLTLL